MLDHNENQDHRQQTISHEYECLGSLKSVGSMSINWLMDMGYAIYPLVDFWINVHLPHNVEMMS
jgi:hypothetical protein